MFPHAVFSAVLIFWPQTGARADDIAGGCAVSGLLFALVMLSRRASSCGKAAYAEFNGTGMAPDAGAIVILCAEMRENRILLLSARSTCPGFRENALDADIRQRRAAEGNSNQC